MIENATAYEVVTEQIEELKARRDHLLHEEGRDAFMLHVEVASIEKMIARLEREIAEYEQTRSQAGN